MTRTLLLYIFCFSCLIFGLGATASVIQTDPAYIYLDTLALKAGTDKSSAFHNYSRVYSKYFDAIRNHKIKFLEIGIYHGDSVKLWESYFVNAELHFVDIDSRNISYYSTRSQYHFADQENYDQMVTLASNLGGNFDIVIDDGGHTMRQQIVSFEALFPYMASGGLYIIEDLHTSYWEHWETTHQVRKGYPAAIRPNSCSEFLKDRVDDLNYTAAMNACADFDKVTPELRKTLNYYQANIDSIHFYQSLCIIIKK